MASNLSESYEKVVLVVALLVALGLGYLAYSKMGKIEDEFSQPSPVNRPAPALPGKPKMDRAGKQRLVLAQPDRETLLALLALDG